jgi:hypothetical protein
MPFQIQQIIDHYRLDQIVARGRATVVFSASDLRLQRRVAFKVLNDEFGSDQSFRERFARESTTAAQLGEHPNIVTVYDANEFEGSLYFVTQFIDGVTLQELLRRQPAGQPLAPPESLIFLDQMASALDFAHRNGVVHRDVKPANIMIRMTESPRTAYLIDFGITKRLDAPTGDTTYGLFVGTADYASPEQIRAEPDIDRRADVYSLACTAFETLTGQAPYASAPDDIARAAAHLEGPVPSVRAVRPQLPEAVDAVFERALAKTKADRYGSCGEFVADLRTAFPADALVFRRPLAPGSSLPAPVVPEPAAGSRRRARRLLLAVVVGLAVVTAAAVGALLLRDRGHATGAAASLSATTTAVTTTTTARPTTSTAIPTTTEPAATTQPATTPIASTAAPTTEPVPTTVKGPFGDVVGQPVAQPTTAQGATVFALQARKLPADIANSLTPTFFYAQWLRLVAAPTSNPVVASADGYVIDADGRADLTAFELGTDGKVITFSECTTSCVALTDAIAVDPPCVPGPDCTAFASDTGGLIAFQRATVSLRSPRISLLFSFTSPQPVTAISEATGAVKFDPATGYFSVTLPGPPPAGTETVATVTFADRTTSKMTITYG